MITPCCVVCTMCAASPETTSLWRAGASPMTRIVRPRKHAASCMIHVRSSSSLFVRPSRRHPPSPRSVDHPNQAACPRPSGTGRMGRTRRLNLAYHGSNCDACLESPPRPRSRGHAKREDITWGTGGHLRPCGRDGIGLRTHAVRKEGGRHQSSGVAWPPVARPWKSREPRFDHTVVGRLLLMTGSPRPPLQGGQLWDNASGRRQWNTGPQMTCVAQQGLGARDAAVSTPRCISIAAWWSSMMPGHTSHNTSHIASPRCRVRCRCRELV